MSSPTPLVIQLNSAWVRAGFAGHDAPTVSFRMILVDKAPSSLSIKDANGASIGNVVGIPKESAGSQPAEKQRVIGADALARRDNLQLTFPSRGGYVTDWEGYEAVLSYTIVEKLRVDPENRVVLLAEPPNSPKKAREDNLEILFEKVGVSGASLQFAPTLSLYSSGRTTGLVLHSGEERTFVVPVYDGHFLPLGFQSSEVAGAAVTKELRRLLEGEGYKVTEKTSNDIKEKICHVGNTAEEATEANGQDQSIYRLPDGQEIKVGTPKSQAPEILFHQSEQGGPLHLMLLESLRSCDVDLRKDLATNVVLDGGNTMLEGLHNRLSEELANASTQLPTKIVAPPSRRSAAWCGGSMFAALSSFKDLAVSREEYDEYGAGIVHQKA